MTTRMYVLYINQPVLNLTTSVIMIITKVNNNHVEMMTFFVQFVFSDLFILSRPSFFRWCALKIFFSVLLLVFFPTFHALSSVKPNQQSCYIIMDTFP